MIRALRVAIHELGFIDGLVYAMDRMLIRLGSGARLHRYYFFAQPIPEVPRLAMTRRSGLQIRELRREDPAFSAAPLTADVLEFRFSQQAICLGAFKAEELVGYLWLCLGPYQEDEVRALFRPWPPDRAVWDFDIYIFPKYRLSRAFVRLWEGANDFLRSRGVTWTISRVASHNRASIASHARLGARTLGSAIFLRRAPAQFMIASLPPYVHLSLLGHRQPNLLLRAD